MVHLDYIVQKPYLPDLITSGFCITLISIYRGVQYITRNAYHFIIIRYYSKIFHMCVETYIGKSHALFFKNILKNTIFTPFLLMHLTRRRGNVINSIFDVNVNEYVYQQNPIFTSFFLTMFIFFKIFYLNDNTFFANKIPSSKVNDNCHLRKLIIVSFTLVAFFTRRRHFSFTFLGLPALSNPLLKRLNDT